MKSPEEKAKEFVADYPTINGRKPERPDVLAYCFEQGHAAARAEATEERARSAKLLSALKFECGNRCAEQNPCNAKLAIREYEKEST
jgi:hypothetical protein